MDVELQQGGHDHNDRHVEGSVEGKTKNNESRLLLLRGLMNTFI